MNRNLSNKLPISWFKTKFIEGINWSSEESSSNGRSKEDIDDEDVVFEDDDDDNTVEPNVYGENVNEKSNFLVETDANIRLMNNYNDCNKNIWLGKLHHRTPAQGTNHTNSAFLWILNDFCDQEDIIEFRWVDFWLFFFFSFSS